MHPEHGPEMADTVVKCLLLSLFLTGTAGPWARVRVERFTALASPLWQRDCLYYHAELSMQTACNAGERAMVRVRNCQAVKQSVGTKEQGTAGRVGQTK